ncbi:MarR family winged helix-turn-helix transcriptional regulator [Caballeronia sp. LZ034LL]|uniref:MarR family winged helix-turn-helix transcriptional regulator n=1 Tax=Caballeronia sp. LZ034LL TaxID=3038567 RepID=UPI0028676246|nr:MarR family winged helix-turn-helix transcriptional regulator [Caballeronia sp. LZ034LL]MDR5835719.1 MarR family winged helix-turn-helix transcriptional regulator [Caballeronia sp. LZ034LL]
MKIKGNELKEMFANVSLGAPERAIGFVLWRMFHRYQRAIDRAMAPLDLTHLQFTVLTLIAWATRNGEEVSQAELSRTSDIHKMQLSQILKTLEAKGWVQRVSSSVDVRMKNVQLTRTGLTRVRKALPLAIDVQRRLFGDEGMPEGDLLKTFSTLLHRIEQETDEAEPG